MSEPDHKQKLAALDKKLSAFKAEQEADKSQVEEHYSQAAVAWRLVTEMVVGLGIGFGIGYALDEVLGTEPWLMVVFTLLGIVAGIKVMMATAAELQKEYVSDDEAKENAPKHGAKQTTRNTGTDEGDRNGG